MLLCVFVSLLAGANAAFAGHKEHRESREIVNPFAKKTIPFLELSKMHRKDRYSSQNYQHQRENSPQSPLHYLKGTPLQDFAHQYLPNLVISQSDFAEEAAKVEAQIKLAANRSTYAPSIRPAFRKDFQLKHNSSSFYYGEENASTGFRHGNGVSVSLKTGNIYLGGWCSNTRNGLGISLCPKKTILGLPHGNCLLYTVGLHRWSMGFIKDSDLEGKELLGGAFFSQLALLNTKGFSLVGLIDLFNCMVDSKRVSAHNGCISSGFASESEAEKPVFQKVHLNVAFKAKDSSTGAYKFKPTLRHSVWVPFIVEEDFSGYLQLYSFKQEYHPTATLFRYNVGASEGKKTLIGTSVGSGNAIKAQFTKGTKFFVEVGLPNSNNSIASIDKGKFRLLLTEHAPLYQINAKTRTTGDFTAYFKVEIGGEFWKGGAFMFKELIGTWSHSIAPFFDSRKRTITWFYLNGPWCGSKRKMGKLELTFQSEKDEFDLNDIEEPEDHCIYTAFGDSSHVGWYIDRLVEGSEKKINDDDE